MSKINLQLFAVDINKLRQNKKYSVPTATSTQYSNGTGINGLNTLTQLASGNPNVITANKVVQAPKSTSGGTSVETSGSTSGKSNASSSKLQATPITNSGTLNGVDKDVYKGMTSEFTTSQAYADAMAVTQTALDRMTSGRTSYTDQMKDLMGQIQGREKFSYDVDNDMLFQQYLSSMMQSGQTAMQDTIGQASALTGGYGSTYATSVGNQAYNQYLQEAYNNLPEYYEMALQSYQMEGEEMYKQLAMLSEADATEYGRLVDSFNANNSMASQIYDREHQAWADKNAMYTNLAQMQNSDWWNTTNFNESVRQYEQNFLENQRQFDEEMDYKDYVTKQDQANFIAMNDYNGDGKVDSKDLTFTTSQGSSGGSGGGSGNKGGGNSGGATQSLTTTEINTLKDVFTKAGGGDAGHQAVGQHLIALGKTNVDNETIEAILNGLDIPSEYQNWTLSKNLPHWKFWQADDEYDEFTSNGVTKTFGQLKKEIEASKNLSDAEKEALINKLRNQTK